MRQVPARCLGLIRAFEGKNGQFEASPTLDPAGNWEIGWGHKLCGPQPEPPPGWDDIDVVKANDLANQDLGVAGTDIGAALGEDTTDSLTEGQYGALCCFVFNIGAAAFNGSTMCRMLKAGNLVMALHEFEKWVYDHDPVTHQPVVERGLVRRRQAEKAMFLS